MTNESHCQNAEVAGYRDWGNTPLTLEAYPAAWSGPHVPITLESAHTRLSATGNVIDALARLDGQTMLNQTALADALHVSTRTVRRLVVRGELPPGVRLGARRVWLVADVLAHVKRRSERAAREAERAMRRIEAHSIY